MGFREKLRKIFDMKDWSLNDKFEAIDELHESEIHKLGTTSQMDDKCLCDRNKGSDHISGWCSKHRTDWL